MIYISLPGTKTRKLSFYLAMEEYVARQNYAADSFFMWQVKPSVIIGIKQDIYSEVNLDFCKENGIQVFRRRSGGGCVYADMTNVMFSYITQKENVSTTFTYYLCRIVEMLRKMGIKATSSMNNDIMIGDRKVSGNAFYHIPGHSIVHGTMLYDTNMDFMMGSITPSRAKLESHAVKSVMQRITLLKEHTDKTLPEFMNFAKRELGDSEITLTIEDVKDIEEIEKRYTDEIFIYGTKKQENI